MGCSQIEGKRQIQNASKPERTRGPNSSSQKGEEPRQNTLTGQATVQIEVKEPEMIKISIPVNQNKKWEKNFAKGSLIKDIVEEYKKENMNDFPVDNDIVWKCNNNKIDVNEKVDKFLPDNDNNCDMNIEYEIFGLPNFTSDVIVNDDLIAKPFASPFEIFVFNKKERLINTITFDEKTIVNNQLNLYSGFSAFCNGNDTLYISGGQNKMEMPLGSFWSINLITKEIDVLHEEMEPKKFHSMIFIPNNYVFIVGGNTNASLYYNTVTKTFENWAKLNMSHKEPALAIINKRYLFVFDTLKFNNTNSQTTFERSDLRKNPIWEIITPQVEQIENNLNYKQKFFGVSAIDDNTVIFLGGSIEHTNEVEQKVNHFEYNAESNLITQTKVPLMEFELREKTFYSMTKNNSFIVPYFNRKNPMIIIFNKSKSTVRTVHFESENEPQTKTVNEFMTVNQNKRKYNFNMPKGNELELSQNQPIINNEIIQPSRSANQNRMMINPENASILPKATIEYEKIEKSNDQLNKYNYNSKEDVAKPTLMSSRKEESIVNIEKREPTGQFEVTEEMKQKEPVIKIRGNNNKENQPKIGETYINEEHQYNLPQVSFNNKKMNMSNSGAMIKSSIIKDNTVSIMKKSKLPSVNKSFIPKTNKVFITKKFTSPHLGDMKSSVNVGLGGKKNISRITN